MPALTVVYVGNFTRPWCTEVHVAGSLEALGHRVERVQENTLDWRQLPSIVQRAGGHLLLWTRTWEVDRDAALAALDELRARGVRSVSYHLDRWWGLAREYQLSTEPFFRTDLVVSPDGGNAERWAEHDIEHLHLPPGVYAAECVPAAPNRRAFPHDVVFVGTMPYPHAEWNEYRTELLTRMEQQFGRRYARHPLHKGRPIRGRSLAQLYASARVVVGDSCLAGGATAYWSDRVPETLGRGGVLLHPHDDTLAAWYPDLPTYPLGDFDAAVAEVERLLALSDDERRELIDVNRRLVLARDTYAHRMTTVLAEVEQRWGFPQTERSVAHAVGTVSVRHSRLRTVRATFQLAEGQSDGIAVREVWEDDTYRLERPHVLNGLVLDVGANVGAFSVLAAKLGAARVHAWEPHPDNHARLLDNLAANAVAGVVTVHHAALAAKPGTLWLSGTGGGVTTTLHDEHGDACPAEAVNDAWAELGDIMLAKIDCEGAEYELIDALDLAVLAQIARLVMEFHGPGMPHLRHLDADGKHVERWGAMVAKLAALGRLDIMGRPEVGGILRWSRY